MPDRGSLTLALVHILVVMLAIGGNFFYVWIFSPVAKKNLNEQDYFRLVAFIIRKFHPCELFFYGVALLTGGWMITRYKIKAGVDFFHEYGPLLGWKLVLVFLVMMVASGKFFGVGTGVVHTIDENLSTEHLPNKIKWLQILSAINLFLLLWAVFLGLRLIRI